MGWSWWCGLLRTEGGVFFFRCFSPAVLRVVSGLLYACSCPCSVEASLGLLVSSWFTFT
eukprot:UN16323